MTDQKWTVIELGGKQHLVAAGSHITVNRLEAKEGDTVTAKNLLDGSSIQLKVKTHGFGPKINGLKFKNKVRYLKRYGHRQPQTVLEVVGAAEAKPKVKKEAE